MQTVWFLIKLMLSLWALQLVVAPIVVYFSNKQSANPQFTTFDLINPPIPLPANYMQSLPLLESLGFQPVAHLFGGALASTVRAVLTLYVNPTQRDLAVVVHMLAEVPPATRLLHTYTEFSTEFEDGHELNTTNSNQPRAFAEVPEKQLFNLPHLTDPRDLYRVHQALASQRPGANKRLVPQGKEVDELINGIKRDLAREASFGRLALDDSGEWYCPTVKGAIYSTFMLIWPVGTLRRMLQHRRGVRLAGEVLEV